MKNKIKVYCRLKPADIQKQFVESTIDVGVQEETLIMCRNAIEDNSLIRPERHSFRFQKVFGQNIKQEDIFNTMAKPVVDRCIHGYNGTLFAYGQTGSGKTFTITGGPDTYEDRGIIPRTIQYLFQTTEQSSDVIYTTTISYVEVYNEVGYDLINPRSEVSKLEDLPRLLLLEDASGSLHLRNLSLHPVANADEALHLLFLGDTNKMIAETPMNPLSSRSHSVFTIHLTARDVRSTTLRCAKLHLVDLAGSERVYKSCIDKCRLVEAHNINLSLHHLEGVITALSEPGRTHIPYRNSTLTSLLRDSLGGNCYTCMVATLSLQLDNFQETLSTCRFAQRVALVSNEARLNVGQDLQQENIHLQAQIKELKAQLAILSSQKLTNKLSPMEQTECKELVECCLKGVDYEPPPDLRKIRFCCVLFKQAVEQAHGENYTTSNVMHTVTSLAEIDNSHDKETKVPDNVLLQQRDNEIEILIQLLRKDHTHPALPSIPKELKNIMTKISVPLSVAEQEGLRLFLGDVHHRKEMDHLKQKLRMKYDKAKQHGVMIEINRSNIEKFQHLLDQVSESEHHKQLQLQLKEEHRCYRHNLQVLQTLRTEAEYLRQGVYLAAFQLLHHFRDWWVSQLELNVRNSNQMDRVEQRQEFIACADVDQDNYRLSNLERICIPEMSDTCKYKVIHEGMDHNRPTPSAMQMTVTTCDDENTGQCGSSVSSLNTDKDDILSQDSNYECISSNLQHMTNSSQLGLQISSHSLNKHQQDSSLSQHMPFTNRKQYTLSLPENVPALSLETNEDRSQNISISPVELVQNNYRVCIPTQNSCCNSPNTGDVALQPKYSLAESQQHLVKELESFALTGDQDVDDEIVKFYTAKHSVFRKIDHIYDEISKNSCIQK